MIIAAPTPCRPLRIILVTKNRTYYSSSRYTKREKDKVANSSNKNAYMIQVFLLVGMYFPKIRQVVSYATSNVASIIEK